MFITIRNKKMQLPIIQGGMGVGISLSRLAGYMAGLGGMGVISAAHPGYAYPGFETQPFETNLKAIKEEIKKAKELAAGKGLVGVNIMVAMRRYGEMVKAVIEGGADAIISGAGLPLELPKYTKGHDILIAPIVSSARAAKLILRTWDKRYGRTADFIVIEGHEAGGHLGFKEEDLVADHCQDNETIFNEVKAAIAPFEKKYAYEIPVFLAGGMYDGKDLAHALQLGAAGVQMATRFICTEECDAALAYKQAFVNAQKEDIVLVKSPVGMMARAINNPFVQKLNAGKRIERTRCYQCLIPCDPKTTPYCITEALIRAVKGDVEDGLVFCGSNAYRNDGIYPLFQVVNQIMQECEENL